MAIIVPVMEIPITVEIPIAEIQAPTGIQASVEAVTQQGVVIREKMYLLLGRILRGFFKEKILLNRKRQISIIWYLPLVLFIGINVNMGYYLVNIN